MTKAHRLSRREMFALRSPFRAGRLHAILDATSYEGLLQALGRSQLDFDSLFSGDDALMLSGEAPYIATLDNSRPKAVRDLLQAARYRYAGFIVESDAGRDDLRRHFAAKLYAIINEGQDMALFRFYDTRILLAFLGTLNAAEAAAFWGPVHQTYLIRSDGPIQIDVPRVPGVSPPLATPLPPMRADQMIVLATVTDHAFRDRLAAYLGDTWTDDVTRIGRDELPQIVDSAIADCPRLEVCREMDIVIMAIARLRVPDLVQSDEFWRLVIADRPNPNQRAGVFLSTMMLNMDRDQKLDFYRRVNGWWDYGKD